MINPAKTVSTMESFPLRRDFPILHQQINGHPLIYFDNAATTQKPIQVIEALTSYYEKYNANIHRGIHTLAEKATHAFETTRETARQFINARYLHEIIFVRGVTEAINLVAASFGMHFIQEGDELIISALEHHSNIVPWQWVCFQRKAKLKIIPINDHGELDLDEFKGLLSSKTKLVALNHASNALGTINPVKEIIRMAHNTGALVLVDGAQAASHLPIDVQELDCDFYCLSAHKMYGPTGIGILYGKEDILNNMPPYHGGGEMIKEVTFEHTTYNALPYKFEAGTPNIADAVAFQYAMDYIEGIGKDNILMHEQDLLQYATEKLAALPYVQMIGTAKEKVGVLSFIIEGIHPFDIGQMLDARGIAVRTGHHCTQPLMNLLGIEGTTRASFAIYNTKSEIDQFVESIERIITLLI
jgi:cysteine desulfurase / selenocysteine lyase